MDVQETSYNPYLVLTEMPKFVKDIECQLSQYPGCYDLACPVGHGGQLESSNRHVKISEVVFSCTVSLSLAACVLPRRGCARFFVLFQQLEGPFSKR